MLAKILPQHRRTQATKPPLVRSAYATSRAGADGPGVRASSSSATPTDRLPDAGGVNATAVVIMTLETLMGGLKAAHLDTGEKISAGQARRLASQAEDHPRRPRAGSPRSSTSAATRRFHTKAQRDRDDDPRPRLHHRRAATGHPACATPTTTGSGPRADPPT